MALALPNNIDYRIAEELTHSVVTFTRPNDTNAYAAKDVISNSTSAPTILTFANIAKAGSMFRIRQVMVSISGAAKTVIPQVQLRLFTKTITAVNDNSAFTITDAEGFSTTTPNIYGLPGISITESWQNTNNEYLAATGLDVYGKLEDGDTNLYGHLLALNAFTQAASDQYVIKLTIARC